MRLLFLSIAQPLTLLTILTGCDSSPPDRHAGANGANEMNLVDAAAVLPAVVTDHIYRCEDSTVISIDYLAGGKQAILKTPDNRLPVRLFSQQAGGTLTFGGYFVVGRGTAISFQRPGSARQQCNIGAKPRAPSRSPS